MRDVSRPIQGRPVRLRGLSLGLPAPHGASSSAGLEAAAGEQSRPLAVATTLVISSGWSPFPVTPPHLVRHRPALWSLSSSSPPAPHRASAQHRTPVARGSSSAIEAVAGQRGGWRWNGSTAGDSTETVWIEPWIRVGGNAARSTTRAPTTSKDDSGCRSLDLRRRCLCATSLVPSTHTQPVVPLTSAKLHVVSASGSDQAETARFSARWRGAVDFDMANVVGPGRLAVRRLLPTLSSRQLARLSPKLSAEHQRALAADLAPNTAAERGRRLALSLLGLGENVSEVEHQLARWHFHPALAAQCAAWASAQRQLGEDSAAPIRGALLARSGAPLALRRRSSRRSAHGGSCPDRCSGDARSSVTAWLQTSLIRASKLRSSTARSSTPSSSICGPRGADHAVPSARSSRKPSTSSTGPSSS